MTERKHHKQYQLLKQKTKLKCGMKNGGWSGWSVVEYYELLHPTIRKTLEQIMPPIDIASPAIDEQVFNAIWRDNLPRLKEYVKAGFDLFDETKDPPFFWTAIRLNHRDIIEYFLELGVDVNYQNKRQKTALMHLVEFHTVVPEQIDYLISKGADPFLLDRDYKSLYDYAIDFIKNNTYFGNTIERKQLAEHIKTTVFKGVLPPSPRDIEERYKQEGSKFLKDVLHRFTIPKEKLNRLAFLAIIYSYWQDLPMIKPYITEDVEFRDILFCGFEKAFETDSVEGLNILIDSGASINNSRWNIPCPLIQLLESDLDSKRCLVFARILLKRGADPNYQGLPLALVKNDLALYTLLLEYGADIYRRDSNGDTVLSYLRKNNYDKGLEIILPMYQESIYQDLKQGTELEIKDNTHIDQYGDTVLISAIEGKCSSEYIKYHMTHINHQNNMGQTALFVAVKKNLFDIVQWLLSEGADPLILDSQENFCIVYATSNEVFTLLLPYYKGKSLKNNMSTYIKNIMEVGDRKSLDILHQISFYREDYDRDILKLMIIPEYFEKFNEDFESFVNRFIEYGYEFDIDYVIMEIFMAEDRELCYYFYKHGMPVSLDTFKILGWIEECINEDYEGEYTNLYDGEHLEWFDQPPFFIPHLSLVFCLSN